MEEIKLEYSKLPMDIELLLYKHLKDQLTDMEKRKLERWITESRHHLHQFIEQSSIYRKQIRENKKKE